MDEKPGVERSEVLHTAHRMAVIAAMAMIVFVALALLFPWPSPPRRSPQAKCVNNLMQLHTAVIQYCSDHQGRFPEPGRWFDEMFPSYIQTHVTFTCPSAPLERPFTSDNLTPTYAMNAKVCGLRLKDIANPSEVVMFFESVPGRDLAGGANLFPHPPRHRDGYPVLFCDGKVRVVPESEIGTLVWEPKMKRREENGN